MTDPEQTRSDREVLADALALPSEGAKLRDKGRLGVYVAGSTRDVERVKGIQDVCRAFGHEITFDWTGAEGEIRTDGSWDTASEAGARIAQREIAACTAADLTILLFPPTGGGLGCWIEMGATLAAGGEVWVLEPGRDSVFWQHPRVRRFPSMRHLMGALAPLAVAA